MAKYNPTADKIRADGNDLFGERKFCEALLAYNLSLCYAETGTESVALAYGNRSAVYFCIEEYELCIQNIKLAKDHNYPVDKIKKLDQRQMDSERLLGEKGPNTEENRTKFFEMRFPANPKQPNLADCIAVKENAKYGKHLITTRDLKPGDVIALIEPTITVFDKRARLHHCSNCRNNLISLSLIPCTRCAKAMYCSEECRATHREKFHQFECPEVNVGFGDEVMCMFCEMLFHFDWNVDSIKQFFDECEGQESVFDFDLSDPSSQYKYSLIALMVSKRKTGGLASSHIPAYNASRNTFIKKHAKLRSIFASKRNKTFLDSLLAKLLRIWTSLAATTFETNIDMTLKEEVALDNLLVPLNKDRPAELFLNAAYRSIDPYQHLLQHCCIPSVMISSFSDREAWIAYIPMSAGDRLTANFLPPELRNAPKLERQKILKECCNQCDCGVCLHGWNFFKESKSALYLLDPVKYEQVCNYVDANLCNIPGDDHASIALEAIDKIPVLHKNMPNRIYWFFMSIFVMSFHRLSLPRLFMISAPAR